MTDARGGVFYERDGGRATLWLNRPGMLNARDDPMVHVRQEERRRAHGWCLP